MEALIIPTITNKMCSQTKRQNKPIDRIPGVKKNNDFDCKLHCINYIVWL